MTFDEALQKFGLPASPADGDEIRRLLAEEIDRARRWEDGEEMLRTLCVQLFSLGVVEDALLIWDAKHSNFDAGCGLDVQFLCGAGLSITKAFLAASKEPTAAEALDYLTLCERAGDFAEFSPAVWVAQYRRYYDLDPTPDEQDRSA